MAEQYFFECKLNFNLCMPKSNKPTLIYAVIYFRRKQYKISTGVKVYPSQWNKLKQIAIISNELTKLDNYNNAIVNDRLKKILISFEQSKFYLCDHIEVIDDFYRYLKTYINPKMSIKMKTKKKTVECSVIDCLCRELSSETKIDDKTKNEYGKKLHHFSLFLKGKGIPDTWANMNKETLEAYKTYMVDKEYIVTTINDRLRFIKGRLLNAYESGMYKDFDFYLNKCADVKTVPDKRNKNERKSKQVALTQEQIVQICELPLKHKAHEAIRDLFVLQCLVGQRISDIPKLLMGNYEIISVKNRAGEPIDLIKIIAQKTNTPALLYLFPQAKSILDKYSKEEIQFLLKKGKDDNETEKLNGNRINERIKVICKKAGLTSTVSYTEQKGTEKRIVTKKLCELIHSHTARHTFITFMCHAGIPKETVIIATAHEDTDMINEVYLHDSSEDKAKELLDAIESASNKLLFMPSQKQDEIRDNLVVSPTDVSVKTTSICSIENLDDVLDYLFAEKDQNILRDIFRSVGEVITKGTVEDKARKIVKVVSDIDKLEEVKDKVVSVVKQSNPDEVNRRINDITHIVKIIATKFQDDNFMATYLYKCEAIGISLRNKYGTVGLMALVGK